AVIQFSLDTRNKAEAKRRRSVEDLKWDAQFNAAEHAGQQTAELHAHNRERAPGLSELVCRYVEHMDRRSRRAFEAQPPVDVKDLRNRKMNAEIELGILQNPQDPRQEEWISLVWDQIEAEAGTCIGDEPMAQNEFF